jgi:acyl phosphate:glycerol-3-phosphate acyltransferase
VILIAWIVGAYLLGSISGSLLLGKLQGVDIRSAGSGNAGGTNALRTRGWKFALGVVLIDIGKGVLALALLPNQSFALGGLTVSAPLAQGAVAFCCVLGHIYPIFFGFRGGKGAATYVGALLVMAPLAFSGMFSVWALVVVLTGYVGPATALAALLAPLFVWLVSAPEIRIDAALGAIAVSLLVIVAHRENLQRLLAGTENRFNRIRLVQ